MIEAPITNDKGPKKISPSAITDALASATRKLVQTDEGVMTAAQVLAERLVNIGMFAASNADAVSAQKLIYERLVGKAAVVKTDESKPMPKIVFNLTQDGLDKVNEAGTNNVIEASGVEDDGSGLVVITDKDTGISYVG